MEDATARATREDAEERRKRIESIAKKLETDLAREEDPAAAYIPRFVKGQRIPIQGFWFEVLGVTRTEHNLVLRMDGPTGATLKKITADKKRKNKK